MVVVGLAVVTTVVVSVDGLEGLVVASGKLPPAQLPAEQTIGRSANFWIDVHDETWIYGLVDTWETDCCWVSTPTSSDNDLI